MKQKQAQDSHSNQQIRLGHVQLSPSGSQDNDNSTIHAHVKVTLTHATEVRPPSAVQLCKSMFAEDHRSTCDR